VRFFCFLFDSSRTARHLLVRALPNSSILIHCIPSVTWDTRVEVGFLVGLKFFYKRSFIRWNMVLVHSSSNHPFSGPIVEWVCDEVTRPHCAGFVTQVCHETPKFLHLNFGRVQRAFQAAGSAQSDRKINHLLDFPLQNLTFDDLRNNKDEYGNYNLLSLIRHEDYNSEKFSHGQYISIARVEHADGASKRVEYNDSQVKIM